MRLMEEEVYILPYDKSKDIKILYSPIRGYVALIGQEEEDAIVNGITNSYDQWKENHKLKHLINTMRESPVKDLNLMQKGLPALNIDFSNGCNMKCIYCYAERGEGCIRFQKKECIDQIVTFYFNYVAQHPNFGRKSVCPIIFSNDAEPTFVPDLLIYTVNLIKQKALEYEVEPHFSMPTNGAFHHALGDFIINNFQSISLSFDGLEAIQNKHRPLVDGSPSYHLVYQNAKTLYNSKIKMGFNIVVTSYNLKYLKETVDYFHHNFPGVSISFSPVNLSGRALKDQVELRIDDTVFHSKLLEAIDYAKTTTIKIRDKNIQNYHSPRRHYCSSTAKTNWNVNLDGEIYACMESKSEVMRIGAINFKTRELELDDKQIQSLKAFTVELFDECITCFAKYLCAGGCKVRNRYNTVECDQIRLKCLYLINQAYEEEQLFKKGQALFRIKQKNKEEK